MVHADVGVCDTIVGQGYTDQKPVEPEPVRKCSKQTMIEDISQDISAR